MFVGIESGYVGLATLNESKTPTSLHQVPLYDCFEHHVDSVGSCPCGPYKILICHPTGIEVNAYIHMLLDEDPLSDDLMDDYDEFDPYSETDDEEDYESEED